MQKKEIEKIYTKKIKRLKKYDKASNIATIKKIYPGETPQPLHQDDGLWPAPRPHPPFVLNTLYAIDPFTCENGGTQLVAGTHKSTEPVDQQAKKVSVEMPVGSVLAWDGRPGTVEVPITLKQKHVVA